MQFLLDILDYTVAPMTGRFISSPCLSPTHHSNFSNSRIQDIISLTSAPVLKNQACPHAHLYRIGAVFC